MLFQFANYRKRALAGLTLAETKELEAPFAERDVLSLQ